MEHLFTAMTLFLGSSLYAAMIGGILFVSGFFRSPFSALALTSFINAVAVTLILLNARENHNWSSLANLPFLYKAFGCIFLFCVWWCFFQKQARLDELSVKKHSDQISKKIAP